MAKILPFTEQEPCQTLKPWISSSLPPERNAELGNRALPETENWEFVPHAASAILRCSIDNRRTDANLVMAGPSGGAKELVLK
jgi:hypothetical protein